jgi:hypothetical protein
MAEAIRCIIGCLLDAAVLSEVPEFDLLTIRSFFFSLVCIVVVCVFGVVRFTAFVGVMGGFEFRSVPTPDVSFSEIDTYKMLNYNMP